jgi:DNA mismatch repair protein MutH
MADLEWRGSPVWQKLRRVLWVPVQGERRIPPAERRVGEPLLWSPNSEQERDLEQDWQELAGIIGRGDVETLTARVGRWLQVRPKAASSRSRRRGLDRDGEMTDVIPRGFYLRASFTARIVAENYLVPD